MLPLKVDDHFLVKIAEVFRKEDRLPCLLNASAIGLLRGRGLGAAYFQHFMSAESVREDLAAVDVIAAEDNLIITVTDDGSCSGRLIPVFELRHILLNDHADYGFTTKRREVGVDHLVTVCQSRELVQEHQDRTVFGSCGAVRTLCKCRAEALHDQRKERRIRIKMLLRDLQVHIIALFKGFY